MLKETYLSSSCRNHIVSPVFIFLFCIVFFASIFVYIDFSLIPDKTTDLIKLYCFLILVKFIYIDKNRDAFSASLYRKPNI